MWKLALVILALLTSCNIGSLPDKDLSKSNIISVELTFPNSGVGQAPINLNTSQIDLLAKALEDRIEGFVEPVTCYNLVIKLRDGGGVNYCTDGIKFQGYDDSSDLPFSFTTKQDILKAFFPPKP